MSPAATVLIVDDVAANRGFLSDILAAQGYRVLTAEGGMQALAMIENACPDLVLLDVIMPDLNGYEVCARVRARFPAGVLPIVMVTALDATEERIRGLDSGADDFISKPINQAELLARVRSLLRGKRLYDTVQSQARQLSELNARLEARVEEQVAQLRKLEQLKRYFSPRLTQLIVEGDVDDPLRTRRREVTVVVLFMQGFTAFADTSEPEEMMALLRQMRARMGQLADEYDGTVEHFASEHMMVVFNDPLPIEEPARRAVRMAVAMQAAAQAILMPWRKLGHQMALGIGVAHGFATIGNVGYDNHVTYGVIGRVSNLAARLSRIAPADGILISAAAQARLDEGFETQEIEHVDLEGFVRPMAVYRLNTLRAPEPKQARVPVRVFTLGQFAVLIDDEPLVLKRKVQKKPLDLLRLLIAQGGSRVDAAALIAQIWPESEGDAGKITFDSNLYRLRRLLGVEDCLPLAEGRLSLSKSLCWVDLWQFEEVVTSIESHRPTDAHTDMIALETWAALLPRLYTGPFLPDESNHAAVLAARDRHKARFLRAVSLLGGHFEALQAWRQAAMLYAHALEMDNVAETLYRRLMIAYREQGEHVEALNTYRRCREMLSIVLGSRPSAETEAVRNLLRDTDHKGKNAPLSPT